MLSKNLFKYLTNPVTCRIFAGIEALGQTTAKELITKYKNIPQATLYRYIKKMTEDGILLVVDEKQVRNVTEKTYTINLDYKREIDKILKENSGEGYLGLFHQFCNGLINEFQAYTNRDNIDIINDGSGFRLIPFFASTNELKELSEKIQEIIKPYYENEPSPDRKLRNAAIIFTPPT